MRLSVVLSIFAAMVTANAASEKCPTRPVTVVTVTSIYFRSLEVDPITLSTTATTPTATTTTPTTTATTTHPTSCPSFPTYGSQDECVLTNNGIYFEKQGCECECSSTGTVSCSLSLVCDGTPTDPDSAYSNCISRHPLGKWISFGDTNSECHCDKTSGCACTAVE
ncbi:hypothetical protein AX774_g4683 [Zancudomyces culisetae]|uniref:Uncharacterized protein n=1 Tax=Zancudomyces culisetae TaxID=1213189 RepID=A0A1R1PD18_ZANCU|nr:hypothetical protein AX774_g7724 [Zancudomyces culisetae]OMH79149.1 hypothetical protein AX774_g7435 [Zancudomyces culisetae]OMH81852.1 hypothetical protein AX774_g4683 [Zancudomyces culisetae]|eukprot:OMH78874.1 hypothetical protein AX774_g7724 [Zancudomyces culisetae]